jgi:hypothetical protein
MATTTLTFSDLVNEVLATLYRGTQRPHQTTVGATALTASMSDVSVTFSAPDDFEAPVLIEIDEEQLLITAKDGSDVFTVVRAYNNTELAVHITGDTVLKSPQWGRSEVEDWVKRYFKTVGSTYFPAVTSQLMYRETDEQWVEIPASAQRVIAVRHQVFQSGRVVDITGWQHERYLPGNVVTSGQLLRLPSTIGNDDELIVSWIGQHDTTGLTIEAPIGTEDLAVLWASAYAVMRREVSRIDLDVITEWNKNQAISNGMNIRLARELWGEFYRRLDEARKIFDLPKHRPYRKMAKVR